MTKLNLCIWVVVVMNLLLNCSTKESTEDSNHIVVVGTAINLKYGAGVISNEHIYYLDEIESWNEKILEKKVRVEGELFVKVLPPIRQVDTSSLPPPPPPQRIPNGYMLIIKKPKW